MTSFGNDDLKDAVGIFVKKRNGILSIISNYSEFT